MLILLVLILQNPHHKVCTSTHSDGVSADAAHYDCIINGSAQVTISTEQIVWVAKTAAVTA